jgi:hypothetical protein
MALASAGAEVTVMGLAGEPGSEGGNPTWAAVAGRRRSRAGSIVSPLPAMAHGFATRAYRAGLADALGELWDAVVIDHLQTGWVVPAVGERLAGTVTVYVSHNWETGVRRDVARAAGRGVRRWFLAADARKVARLEQRVVGAAELVTAITDEDAAAFRASGARRVVVLPPGYDGEPVARRITGALPRRAVLFGNFQWHVKDANLARFLEVADPVFAAAHGELRVVGPAGERTRALGNRLRATTLVGWVDDPVHELASCRLGIVAEPVGGGFKMKTLDFVFNGVPLVVLAGSAKGLPLRDGESVVECPDETSLARTAVALIDDVGRLDALQRAAIAACAGAFRWSDRGALLRDEIAACRTALR